MVEPALYAAFGACLATLILLLFLPAFWRRAVRLTTRRLAGKLPLSVAEIVAAQDRLRAEHAMTMRATERRAEAMAADAARERAEVGRTRSDELALKAEIANLHDNIFALEAHGALVRVDLDRTGAEAAASAKALDAADTEAKSAARERDAALRRQAAAELAADGLRIDLAAAEAALASARADLAETRKRLGAAGSAHVDRPASTATDASRSTDADATKLAALRARLDEVADEIVRAAGASDGARPKDAGPSLAGPAADERERTSRLLPSHA